MRKKRVGAIAIKSFALLVVLGSCPIGGNVQVPAH
jgi:hypothetical protein